MFFGDGDGGRGLQHSAAIVARILQTPKSFSYSKRNTCHARLTCTRIRRTRIVGALARVFLGIPLTSLTLESIESECTHNSITTTAVLRTVEEVIYSRLFSVSSNESCSQNQ